MKPILDGFTKLFDMAKEPLAKFLPKLNKTITTVDRMYTLGKSIFLKWW